jgi:hypothetical protein
MTSQLSWQPPPVTKCGECPLAQEAKAYRAGEKYCPLAVEQFKSGFDVYNKNKDGITPMCPMWQQQKASFDATAREIANRRGKSVVKVWFDEATKQYKEVK